MHLINFSTILPLECSGIVFGFLVVKCSLIRSNSCARQIFRRFHRFNVLEFGQIYVSYFRLKIISVYFLLWIFSHGFWKASLAIDFPDY